MRLSRPPSLALVSFFALIGVLGLQAQLLAPERGLGLIETASFSIYFPIELEVEAQRLSAFAEEVLAGELGRFGGPLGHRLPILLTDQQPETNGFFTSSPSDRLVLMIKPPRLDEAVASLADPLRDIFAHELAHALSMSSRPLPLRLVSWLLGDQVAGAYLASPSLSAEGVAIVAEGSGRELGLGRAWDPLSSSIISQNIAEDRWPDFWKATGAGGGYPFGSTAYAYGGPFAAWLEENYGKGSLALLFANFGALRAPEDGLLRRGAFSKTFGRDLPLLWEDYRASMTLEAPILTETRLLVDHPGFITALTAGVSGGRETTFWADASEGAVLALAGGGGRPRRLFAADGHINRLDLSPDGSLLLVSTVVADRGLGRLALRIWDLETERFLPESYANLREGAWAGGEGNSRALLAIAPRGMLGDLVLIESGRERVLLRGTPDLALGNPVALSNGTIAFLARVTGRPLLCKIDAEGRLMTLTSNLPLENLRFLTGRDERLLLGTASQRGLYRLLLIEGDGGEPRLRVQGIELSGGLGSPALRSAATGEDSGLPSISYVASLSDGDYPADYPGELTALDIKEGKGRWEALSIESEGEGEAGKVGTGPRDHKAPPLPLVFRTSRFPVLSGGLDAAGLLLSGLDLSERLAWTLEGEYSWGAAAYNFGASLDLGLAPWRLGLTLEDRFEKGASDYYARNTRGSAELSLALSGFPLRRQLEPSLLLVAGALAGAPEGAPYSGDYAGLQGGARIGLVWRDNKASYFPPFERRGLEASFAADVELGGELGVAELSKAALALEARLDVWLPLAGIHAQGEVAASPNASLLIGPGGRLLASGGHSILDPGFTNWDEFSHLGFFGDWYARGELGLRLADLEIMRRIPLLGFYARRLVLETGARGGLLGLLPGSSGAPLPLNFGSVFSRLSLEAAPLLGLLSQTGLVAGLEVEYALTPYDLSSPWRLGILLGARL